MSNKKQQQSYIGKPAAAVEVGPAPPRYQPPPQPGILKHIQQPPVPLAQTSTNSAPKDVKQHHPYPYRLVPPNTVKQPYNPNVPEGVVKFVPQLPINGVVPHGSKTAYPVPQYPPVGYVVNPNQAIPQQHRPVRSSAEDPHAQTQPPALRVQKKEEEFVKTHQRAQEEFLQAPAPAVQGRPPEDFNRGQIVYRTQRLTDEEFLRLTPVEMLKFVRKTENEGARIASEQHRHMQNLVNELRTLKEANQRLSDDNQELRDLCCFLDDDRQKGRKLAREWQRFGRYTASVMRQEVSAYQNKLRELDNKQQELIKDNLELKELCLYLDEERGGSSLCPSCGSASSGVLRDDGDGSSSSTNADEPAVPAQFNNGGNAPRRSASRERFLQDSLVRQRSMFNDQMMQYVRNLEQRVKQLEDEKRALLHKMSQLNCDGDSNAVGASAIDLSSPVLTGRPEAVVRALQVLEVREQLERDRCVPDHEQHNVQNGSVETTLNSDMDDGEKALVREMCNVVWRKLEDAPAARR